MARALPEGMDRLEKTSAAERLPDLAIVIAPGDELLHASGDWEAIFGEPPAFGRPIFETSLADALGESARAQLKASLGSVRRALDVEPLGLPIVHPRLGARVLQVHAHRSPADASQLTLLLRDATEDWEQLTRLVDSEHRFGTLARASRDMVTETDYDSGRFTYLSAAAEAVLGHAPDQLVGTPALALHHPEDLRGFVMDVRSRSEGAAFSVRPHRLRRCDGSWIWVEATGIRFRGSDGRERVIGVARDISARLEAERVRLELESQLQRSQRLESLGVLAGGIAHDFNNLLTPILGSAAVQTGTEAQDRDTLLRRLETIHASARRAKALTDQMLSYAGRSAARRAGIDLSKAVRDMLLLLEATASRSTVLHCELDDDLPPIEADPNQIGQIVMNLVANASEAARPEGGRIEVRTCVVDACRALLDACVLGDQLEAGRYACLEVSDDGRGMDAETRDRVFEPFFTTKFTGRGLGLAVVSGILRRHGGALEVDSEPGVGSRFRVLLPAAPEGRWQATAEAPPALAMESNPTGALLVVDDDEGARELTSILLRRAGFTIHEASGGAQAVEIFRERVDELAGVVLDSTMPGMSGASAFASIREIEPSARVLLISGYTSDRGAEALLDRGLLGFLQKPFEPDELIGAVNRLLKEDVRPV
jgi:PAS domain S-box-containing protein